MDIKIKVYAKAQNRLALGIIQAYVILHPLTTLDDLNKVFPHSINPDSGVKENFIDVTKVHEKQGEKWNGFFVKETELISLADETPLSVVSMWTKPSLERLLKKAAQSGIEGELVEQLPEQACLLCGDDTSVLAKSVGYTIELLNGYEPQSRLLLLVEEDVRTFFGRMATALPQQGKNIFFNEKDFQIKLSIYLSDLKNLSGEPKYDDVKVEYYIPQKELGKEYERWNNNIFLDIVVEKDGVYLPIELKYNTTPVSMGIERFGEVISDEDIIKYQGATNDLCYYFWKDVRRLELVKQRFPRVKNGIALILTNNFSLKKGPRESALYYQFSLADGKHSPSKHWKKEKKDFQEVKSSQEKKDSQPDFELSKSYTTTWQDITLEGAPFMYNIVEV